LKGSGASIDAHARLVREQRSSVSYRDWVISRFQHLGLALLFASALECAVAAGGETNAGWWSFKPASRPAVPDVAIPWVRNPIDAFVLTTLHTRKIEPSPEADRRTLIRRLSFDLTGLPPMPEEVAGFVGDSDARAYERLVDRLLASPRYGERWARHWLDTVHYGESHGYEKDKPRLNAWPYRDYVIASFNNDKPYSRFVEEQLAADVLFPNEPFAIPALGFIAAGPWDFVGHVELPITKMDGLLARYNDRDDMVMNAMSTFQSLTVHCARCHDHKFDPISQRDYYRLQAVFAGVDRADRKFDSDPEVAKERTSLTRQLSSLLNERSRISNEVSRLGGEALRIMEARMDKAARPAAKSAAFGYHSAIASSANVVKWVQVDLGQSREIDRISLAGCHDDFNGIGAGFGFPLRYRIEVSDDPAFAQGVIVIQDNSQADVPNPGTALRTVEVCKCLTDDGSPVKARYVRITATKLALRKDDYIFALAEVSPLDADGRNLAASAVVTAMDSIEAPPRWGKSNLVDGWHPGAPANGDAPSSVAEIQAQRRALLERVVPEELRAAGLNVEQRIAETRAALGGLPKPRAVYAAAHDFAPSGSFLPAKSPRPVHLLKRGDVNRPGEEMPPGAIEMIPIKQDGFNLPPGHDEGLRRAALARWITDRDNMLTRRSIVNRVWQYHFGRGLVDTPNDFGRMGSLPTHPDLLDWLAFWFMDNGESLKKLHRLIVTSATYRQLSQPETVPAEDSANTLLWRMNRARLDAEQVRDSILAISGDLDLTMGGPSIQHFRFKDDHSPVYDYGSFNPASPEGNRRSIYRFIVRSVPDPLMDTLDCPDANLLTPTRNVTMTALQALALLNDAFVLRQCERVAQRLVRERPALDDQIVRAYELTLSRQPNSAERTRLTDHAREHGLASACRVLFNSNEFLFID
jgi:hypothetical protein